MKTIILLKPFYELTKEKFYGMRLDNKKTVFEYLMQDVINESFDGNNYFILDMPVEYTKVVKDSTSGIITSTTKVQEEKQVYIQYKFDYTDLEDKDMKSVDALTDPTDPLNYYITGKWGPFLFPYYYITAGVIIKTPITIGSNVPFLINL